MLFEQVTEAKDGCLIRRSGYAKIYSGKAS
jgi:hypothetical protein